MKKILVIVLVAFSTLNIACAKVYDLSQISRVKLVTEYSSDTAIDQMDTVKFGSYYQSDSFTKEPIEWIVLDRQGGKAFLLSKYILDCKCYNNENKNVTWETCSLRNWLNNDFYYQAFNDSEQGKIQMTNVINSNNPKSGTNAGNNTKDKIFCLSVDEVKQYFYQSNMKSANRRLATRGTNYAKNLVSNGRPLLYVNNIPGWYRGNSSFWLRSPGSDPDEASDVADYGYLSEHGYSVEYGDSGVRPALWVSY